MRIFLKFCLLCLFVFLTSPKPTFATDILINEFIPNPGTGNSEWVVFYNTTSSTVDLSDYFFDDDTNFDSDSGTSGKIALSGLLPSSQTCFQDLSTLLNNNGDAPTLFKIGNSSPIDTYTYSSSSAGLTYLRIPNGGEWNINQAPSKSSNKCIDLAPPATPTPTDTPTKEPTPTRTPTPTPFKTPTPTPSTKPTVTKAISKTATKSANLSGVPTSVLGTTDKAPDKNKKESKKVLVASENKNKLRFYVLAAGLLLLACAILVFLKERKGNRV